jgi:hypothetical protein
MPLVLLGSSRQQSRRRFCEKLNNKSAAAVVRIQGEDNAAKEKQAALARMVRQCR